MLEIAGNLCVDERLTLPHVKVAPFTFRSVVPYLQLLATYKNSVTSITQINVNHKVVFAIVYTFHFPFIAHGNQQL